jgi:DNA-binding PadR family transcriptional regulator
MPERITKTLLALLEVLLSDPAREWYGLELIDATAMSSGTLYPLLHRLTADGWLERTRDVQSDAGGTGRRMYKLTGLGARAAAATVAATQRSKLRRPAPRPRLGAQPA